MPGLVLVALVRVPSKDFQAPLPAAANGIRAHFAYFNEACSLEWMTRLRKRSQVRHVADLSSLWPDVDIDAMLKQERLPIYFPSGKCRRASDLTNLQDAWRTSLACVSFWRREGTSSSSPRAKTGLTTNLTSTYQTPILYAPDASYQINSVFFGLIQYILWH